MSNLRFGRYFVLEGKIASLFSWLEHHLELEWSVEAKGICPTMNQLVLGVVFSAKEDLRQFEAEFLDNQKNGSSIYNNRRNCVFDWPAAHERRGGLDRRQCVSKTAMTELQRRFVEREVTELVEIQDENYIDSASVC